jgi:hypothetical protein
VNPKLRQESRSIRGRVTPGRILVFFFLRSATIINSNDNQLRCFKFTQVSSETPLSITLRLSKIIACVLNLYRPSNLISFTCIQPQLEGIRPPDSTRRAPAPYRYVGTDKKESPVRLGGRVLLAGVTNIFFGLHRTFCFLTLYIPVVCARCVIVPHFYRKISL